MGKVRTQAVVWLAILLSCCVSALALDPSLDVSQYAHTSWKIRDGFTKGVIGSIAQTPDGYLWLGTEFGLLRFDGVRAVPWQPSPGEHLPDSNIRKLLAARDGTLWVGTSRGLASWKGGRLTQYPEFAGGPVSALLEDREGTIWVGLYALPAGRLCAVRIGRAQCYGEAGSFGHGVQSLYEDSKGNLWVGALNGLWRWKPGPPKFYPLPKSLNGIPSLDGVGGLIEGDGGTLLVGIDGGMMQLIDGKFEAYSLPAMGQRSRPNRPLRDRDGGIWIGTDRGLLHVHGGRTDAFARSDGLSGDGVYSLLEDREGNIWVATLDGLDRFRDYAVPTISVKQGLSSSLITSVLAARDGSVWLGTNDGGLDRINQGKITIYRSRNPITQRIGQAGTSDVKRGQRLSGLDTASQPSSIREISGSGLPYDGLQSIFQDNEGRIWVSSRLGLAYFENGRFFSLGGVSATIVHSIAGDAAGNLWINEQNQGLIHLDGRRVIEQISWSSLRTKDFANAIVVDPSKGGLWLGLYHGGLAYLKDGQVRASYTPADGMGDGRVNNLQLDRDGTVWAATEGGLSRVKDGHAATLTSKNGLPCDNVLWEMEDNAGSVWLYTACGLVRIARTELDAWASDPKRTVQVYGLRHFGWSEKPLVLY